MNTDRPWFDEFVRQHHEALLRFALSLCRDPHLAQDLVQETFLKMWRKEKAGEVRGIPSRYFATTILLNSFRDHLRSEERQRELFEKVGEVPPGIVSQYPSDKAADRERIVRFLKTLPERQQAMFFMNIVGGFKPAEIAEYFGLKPGTVSNYLSKIRKLIRDEHSDLDGS